MAEFLSNGMESVGNNSMLLGGLILLLANTLSRFLELALGLIGQYVFRLVFVTIDVDNTQEAYVWVTTYLSHLHKDHKAITTWGTLTVVNDLTSTKLDSYRYREDQAPESAKSKTHIHYLPGVGIHFLRYGWRWIMIKKSSEATVGRNDGHAKELLWMGTLGLSESFFTGFIEKARDYAFSSDHESTVVYTLEPYRASWLKALSKGKRSWESVILDGTLSEEIYQDCKNFLESRDWYQRLGVPYKRSFLLESSPGCGKSSFIQALAGRLNFDLCYLSLSSPGLNDGDLAQAMRNTPPDSIILLEELDVAFPDRTKITREEEKKRKQSDLTMSGLLNALDGLVAPEGKLLFFTTNHMERLDPALLRPGRVDRIISLKLASHRQIETLFLRFHPNMQSVAKLYARGIPEFTISMAQVQSHLLTHRLNPLDAVSALPEYLEGIRAAQRRREQYEAKLRMKDNKRRKKKKDSDDEDDEDDGGDEGDGNNEDAEGDVAKTDVEPAAAPAAPVAAVEEVVVEKVEEKVVKEVKFASLSQSVQNLDNASLEAQAAVSAAGGKVRRRKRKTKIDLTATQ